MVILIWLYLNSIAILIGFELNVSIMAARDEDSEKKAASTEAALLTNKLTN